MRMCVACPGPVDDTDCPIRGGWHPFGVMFSRAYLDACTDESLTQTGERGAYGERAP